MKKFRIILGIVFNFYCFSTFAQGNITVSGKVRNKSTNENIPLAHIFSAKKMIGSVSNTKGDYIIKLPLSIKNDTLVFSHLGFETVKIPIKFQKDTNIHISLTPVPIQLPEVSVTNITVKAILDSAIANIDNNYPSDPLLLDVFMRIKGLYNSEPKSYRTGGALGEFALQVYKNPYKSFIESKKTKDQVKYLEWQKTDTLTMSNAQLYFYLFTDWLPVSDILNKLNNSFIYNKKWLKNNEIFYDGIVSYQHGRAYKIKYRPKPNAKEEYKYEGVLLFDTKSFALVSYERFIKPREVEYYEFKTGIFKFSFNWKQNAFYIKYSYEKIGDKWYLGSIYNIQNQTDYYENKGMGFVYFIENEDLEKASVESYYEATMVVTKITKENVQKFENDDLLTLKDIKPFVLTDNNIEFEEKYNTISNSDTRFEKRLQKKVDRVADKLEEEKKTKEEK